MWTHETKEYAPSKEKTTKMTLQNDHVTISVEVPQTEMTICTILRDVVKPVLMAAGYSEELVDNHLELD